MSKSNQINISKDDIAYKHPVIANLFVYLFSISTILMLTTSFLPEIAEARPCGRDIFSKIGCGIDPTNPARNGGVIDPIITKPLGRCKVAGEATIYVKNNLEAKINVLVNKSGIIGSEEKDLEPGQGFQTKICNRDGMSIKIFTPQSCGKTFLGESRFNRVYNAEYVSINPNGIKFSTGDFLDIAGRGAGFALTYIAQGYGVPPEALAAMGVREGTVVSICSRMGSVACAGAIYKWLPSDLLSTIKSDRCLSQAFNSSNEINPSPIQPQINPPSSRNVCVLVDSRQGWQRFSFPDGITKVTSISGGWSVDTRNYAAVSATGYDGRDAESLAPYNQYKFDQRFPFGALLMKHSTKRRRNPVEHNGVWWNQKPESLEGSSLVFAINMRINDADNSLGDNEGSLNVCFGK